MPLSYQPSFQELRRSFHRACYVFVPKDFRLSFLSTESTKRALLLVREATGEGRLVKSQRKTTETLRPIRRQTRVLPARLGFHPPITLAHTSFRNTGLCECGKNGAALAYHHGRCTLLRLFHQVSPACEHLSHHRVLLALRRGGLKRLCGLREANNNKRHPPPGVALKCEGEACRSILAACEPLELEKAALGIGESENYVCYADLSVLNWVTSFTNRFRAKPKPLHRTCLPFPSRCTGRRLLGGNQCTPSGPPQAARSCGALQLLLFPCQAPVVDSIVIRFNCALYAQFIFGQLPLTGQVMLVS